MKLFIVDASVAVKWLIPENGSVAAAQFLESDAAIIAPAWLLAEVANILWKHVRAGDLTPSEASQRLRVIRHLEPCLVAHEVVLERAFDLAVALNHPVYDTLYLALAERMDGVMITADNKFVQKVSATRWARYVQAL